MKGKIEEELIDTNQILKKNHCKIKKINQFLLPKEASNRSLVVIKK